MVKFPFDWSRNRSNEGLLWLVLGVGRQARLQARPKWRAADHRSGGVGGRQNAAQNSIDVGFDKRFQAPWFLGLFLTP